MWTAPTRPSSSGRNTRRRASWSSVTIPTVRSSPARWRRRIIRRGRMLSTIHSNRICAPLRPLPPSEGSRSKPEPAWISRPDWKKPVAQRGGLFRRIIWPALSTAGYPGYPIGCLVFHAGPAVGIRDRQRPHEQAAGMTADEGLVWCRRHIGEHGKEQHEEGED